LRTLFPYTTLFRSGGVRGADRRPPRAPPPALQLPRIRPRPPHRLHDPRPVFSPVLDEDLVCVLAGGEDAGDEEAGHIGFHGLRVVRRDAGLLVHGHAQRTGPPRSRREARSGAPPVGAALAPTARRRRGRPAAAPPGPRAGGAPGAGALPVLRPVREVRHEPRPAPAIQAVGEMHARDPSAGGV